VGHRTSPSKMRLRKWVWLAAFTNGEPWVVAGGDGERLLQLGGVKGGGEALTESKHYVKNSNRTQIGDARKGNHLRSEKMRRAHITVAQTWLSGA
jgi:hypothetical protein